MLLLAHVYLCLPLFLQKVCAALGHNDPVDDIKVGCTGAIAQDAIVVKGWAEGDNPQGLHIRCAKRLWEEKVTHIYLIFSGTISVVCTDHICGSFLCVSSGCQSFWFSYLPLPLGGLFLARVSRL